MTSRPSITSRRFSIISTFVANGGSFFLGTHLGSEEFFTSIALGGLFGEHTTAFA